MKKQIKLVRIKNKQSKLYLGVKDDNRVQIINGNNYRSGQEFYLFPIKHDDYFIASKHSGKVIEVEQKF